MSATIALLANALARIQSNFYAGPSLSDVDLAWLTEYLHTYPASIYLHKPTETLLARAHMMTWLRHSILS